MGQMSGASQRWQGPRPEFPWEEDALSAPDLRCEFDQFQKERVFGRDKLTGQTGLPGIWEG